MSRRSPDPAGPGAVLGPGTRRPERPRRIARGPRGRASLRGGVPAWLPLGVLFTLLFLGVRALEHDARGHGVAEIDTTRYRLQLGSQWLSPAWRAELEDLLVASRGLLIDEPEAIEAFTERVASLPFVAEVGAPKVQWPDGLSIPLRLHEPVACIPSGEGDFLPVAADGTVLGGYAFAPHEAYGGWLPTLGPHGALGIVRPGDRIVDPKLLRALDVATGLWRFLDVADLRRLGRILIDASAERAPVFDRDPATATPRTLEGGVVLGLEGGRSVIFGRPPTPVTPGELPVGRKWRHLAEALADHEAGDDWRLLDVRFDDDVRLDRAAVEEYAAHGVLTTPRASEGAR